MFLRLTLLSIFSLSLTAHARAPGTYNSLKSELQKVSKNNLMGFVTDLVKVSSPSRMVGLPGHERAAMFLQEKIKELDPKNTGKLEISSSPVDADFIKKFYQTDFEQKLEGKVPRTHPEYQKWLKFTFYMQGLVDKKKDNQVKNIVWEKSGLKADKLLLVTAHYDTISHDKETLAVKESEPMPGANYNASGVAVALGLIQTLAQMDLNYSVRVVFLDWQGIGFYGSQVLS